MDFKPFCDDEQEGSLGDVILRYRPCLPRTLEAVYSKHTKKGVLNTGAAHDELIDRFAVGWENVTVGGQPAEFSADLAKRISKVRSRFLELIRGDEDPKDDSGNP